MIGAVRREVPGDREGSAKLSGQRATLLYSAAERDGVGVLVVPTSDHFTHSGQTGQTGQTHTLT